jgi:hypothetical protein
MEDHNAAVAGHPVPNTGSVMRPCHRLCGTLPDFRRVESWQFDLGLAGSKPLYPALIFRGGGIGLYWVAG